MKIVRIVIKEILLIPLRSLKIAAKLYSTLLSKIKPGFGSYLDDQIANKNKLPQQITHKLNGGGELKLKVFTPNNWCKLRADTFSTDPETLEWMDKFGGNGVLFDIGANVGLISMYYAATKKGNVYAFEPSVFNLAGLAKNIYANNLEGKIKIVTNPLTDKNQFADFTLQTTEEGGSGSSFGVDYGFGGRPINKSLSYQTLGFSLDFLMSNGVLAEYPEMIKIDVDGIEHLILAGAIETLKNPTCKTILIEVSPTFKQQVEEVSQILKSCGFSRDENPHSGLVENENHFHYNQIWIKS